MFPIFQAYGETPKKTYPLHTAYVKEDAFVEGASTCSCNQNNGCPAGPAGTPGKPVSRGERVLFHKCLKLFLKKGYKSGKLKNLSVSVLVHDMYSFMISDFS